MSSTTDGGPLTSLPDTLQRVLPRTIPGPVSPPNKGALHWGWQGYLAYGCQCTVVVVEPGTAQCVQTLNGHTSHVTKVAWRGTQHYHQLSAAYSLLLASGDAAGQLRVWDVATGHCSVLGAPQGNKQVAEVCWLTGCSEGREHLLLALYPPHRLVLWDARHQTRLWTKTYTHSLTAVALDPFCGQKMAFLCDGCVLFADDLHPSRCPSSNGTKFYVAASGSGASGSPATASPTQGGGANPPGGGAVNQGGGAVSQGGGANTLRRRMRALVGGDNRTRSEELAGAASPCLQLAYHNTAPERLLLLYPRELLVIDLAINVTVGVLALDRPASPFTQVVSCWREDVLYCLHESGTVSVHERRLQPPSPAHAADGCSELVYEKRCQSDALRLAKNNTCMGISLEPVQQTSVGMVLGDGRVLFKELSVVPAPPKRAPKPHPVATRSSESSTVDQLLGLAISDDGPPPAEGEEQAQGEETVHGAEEQRQFKMAEDHFGRVFEGEGDDVSGALVTLPDLSISSLLRPQSSAKLRLVVSAAVPPLSSPPFVVRMCPPLTTRNLSQYRPRVAVGNSAGSLLLVNAATGAVLREMNVHTCPVRGIEWTSLDSVLSFAHQPLTGAQGQVRNELFHVDLAGGVSTQLRGAAQQESPILAVRVSYLKQYFLVARRSEPLELWCCASLSLLRTLPLRFPLPTALEWSPTSHVRKKRRKSDSVNETDANHSRSNNPEPSPNSDPATVTDPDFRLWPPPPGGEQSPNTSSNPAITSDLLTHDDSGRDSCLAADDSATGSLSTITSSNPSTWDTRSATINDATFSSSTDVKRTMTTSATFPSAAAIKAAADMGLSASMMTSSTSMSDISGVERVVKETFMLSDSEGSLYHLSVEGNVIKDGVKVPADPSVQRISSIACKSHLMVLADTDSNLSLWDLSTRSSGHVNAGRGPVKKIRFAPGRDNLKLLVLFADGADVWDMKDVQRVGRITADGNLRVVDGDWAASDRPLLATADGCIRVMDVALRNSHSPLLHYCTEESVGSPYLLPCEASLNLRTLLTHQPWRPRYSLVFTKEDGFSQQQLNVIHSWLSRVPAPVREFLVRCRSSLHRALVVATLFGDQSELRFWTVAAHYLPSASTSTVDNADPSTATNSTHLETSNSSVELISLAENNTNSSSNNSNISISSERTGSDDFASVAVKPRPLGDTNVAATSLPLGTSYDLFCDSRGYRISQLERLSLHSSKLLTGDQKARLCRQLSLLGERDRAVKLLLDEESHQSGYYTSCLRACLVAATQHSAQSSSTIKLVATNLIAAGRVEEGVELLCLVGKGSEACGYLQSYGRWQESVWLARCCPQLDRYQRAAITKWAQHLLLQGDKEGCVLALLSGGAVWEAVQQLASQHYHQRSALLLQAAVETAALDKQLLPQHRGHAGTNSDVPGDMQGTVTPVMMALADNVHRKYALFLFGLANRAAVAHLCRQLGEAGDGIMGHLSE